MFGSFSKAIGLAGDAMEAFAPHAMKGLEQGINFGDGMSVKYSPSERTLTRFVPARLESPDDQDVVYYGDRLDTKVCDSISDFVLKNVFGIKVLTITKD